MTPAAGVPPKWVAREMLRTRMPALDAQLLAHATEHWPDAPLGKPSVLEHLAARLAGAQPASRLDLVFAALVLSDYPPAVAQFEALVRTEARRALGPIDQATTFVDEVNQLVLERLLVSTPTQHARLADYAGQGPLSAWLRAVATRLALNARRSTARVDFVSQVPDGPLAAPDPEFAALRRSHQLHFKQAFEHALTTLTARERTLLRLTTLDGLTLAQVGSIYAKDASTVSRWLTVTRATLLEKTRERLSAELGLTTLELDSVMRVAESDLNVSLSRLLQSSVGR